MLNRALVGTLCPVSLLLERMQCTMRGRTRDPLTIYSDAELAAVHDPVHALIMASRCGRTVYFLCWNL